MNNHVTVHDGKVVNSCELKLNLMIYFLSHFFRFPAKTLNLNIDSMTEMFGDQEMKRGHDLYYCKKAN